MKIELWIIEYMKAHIIIFITFLFSFFTVAVYAQDKTQAYYAQHEREILPDAQTAFSVGNYERAAQLCRWHYIIVGDRAADSLRDKAENCQNLLEEIKDLTLQGKSEAALEKALVLLELNPEDSVAKELFLTAESAVSESFDEEIQSVPEPEPVTTEESRVYTVEPIMIPEPEPEPAPALSETYEAPQYIPQKPIKSDNRKNTDKTKFGIKAGVSILDFKNVSQSLTYGGSVGLYDIVGTRFGFELGALFSPDLSGISSFIEVDASIAVRAMDWLYPKVTGGFFSCKSKAGNSPATNGMCGGAGLSFLIGNQFCIDVGAKYYPIVRVYSIESMTVLGQTLEIPSVLVAIPRGITPFLSLGFVF